MLVLSRKESEKIEIGGKITICVLGIRGDKVVLGIEAPADVAIHREEIARKIEARAAEAAAQA